jgi:hypothetical protein
VLEVTIDGSVFGKRAMKNGEISIRQITGGQLEASRNLEGKWWVRSQEGTQNYFEAGPELREFIERIVKAN